MQARKPKFEGKKTKWEKKRTTRPYARQAKGKKPLVEPLMIAPLQERRKALKEGRMVFYERKKKIELPLVFSSYGCNDILQGLFNLQGKKVVLRFNPRGREFRFFELKHVDKKYLEEYISGFVWAFSEDFGHMWLDKKFRGHGLGIKTASKSERIARAEQGGKFSFVSNSMFEKMFKNLGYSVVRRFTGPKKSKRVELRKEGKRKLNKNRESLDDLSKFHRIEAIDPKTGKARIFTFPIKGKK